MKVVSILIVLLGFSLSTAFGSVKKCTFNMENGRGQVIETFTSRDRERFYACKEARENCEYGITRLERRQRRNLDLACVEDLDSGRNGRRAVARCMYELTDRMGNILRVFTETGFARTNRHAMQRACREAMRACQTQRRGRQRCDEIRRVRR